MALFTAHLLYECKVDGMPIEGQASHEYRMVITSARLAEEAMVLAKIMGEKQQESYPNELGKMVSWDLVEVIGVTELFAKEISDGEEVFHLISDRGTVSRIKEIISPSLT